MKAAEGSPPHIRTSPKPSRHFFFLLWDRVIDRLVLVESIMYKFFFSVSSPSERRIERCEMKRRRGGRVCVCGFCRVCLDGERTTSIYSRPPMKVGPARNVLRRSSRKKRAAASRGNRVVKQEGEASRDGPSQPIAKQEDGRQTDRQTDDNVACHHRVGGSEKSRSPSKAINGVLFG